MACSRHVTIQILSTDVWFTRSEYVPHCDHCMQVTADPLCVHGEQVSLGRHESCIQTYRFHGRVDLLLFIKTVDVRHITRVQDVVYVLEE